MTRRADEAADRPRRRPERLSERIPRRPALEPARVAELRRRIAAGECDSPEVAERVARRILASGEV